MSFGLLSGFEVGPRTSQYSRAEKGSNCHINSDNFFWNSDLLVNLKNVSVRAIGTVRAKRVTGVSN